MDHLLGTIFLAVAESLSLEECCGYDKKEERQIPPRGIHFWQTITEKTKDAAYPKSCPGERVKVSEDESFIPAMILLYYPV